jgi:hypothetical protein
VTSAIISPTLVYWLSVYDLCEIAIYEFDELDINLNQNSS